MAQLLSPGYFGSTVSAFQLPDEDTRIYYQGADGAIYQLIGLGSVPSGTKYHLGQVLVPASGVRVNTPIAVTFWPPDAIRQIRVYYIDRNNLVRELVWNVNQNFVPGDLNGKNFKAAPNSGFLYAINNGFGSGAVRVGFQAAEAPGCITETQWNDDGSGWTAEARLVGT